jgi:ribonuclease VapC
MIAIDTSAVVAIFRQEEDAAFYAGRIAGDDEPLMSAANIVETSLVLRGLKMISPVEAEAWLNSFLTIAGIRIESVTAAQADIARAAHVQFGKSTGHAAGLNYGDCFAYALAKAMTIPLLFKGEDFAKTDLTPALRRP